MKLFSLVNHVLFFQNVTFIFAIQHIFYMFSLHFFIAQQTILV